MREKTLEPFNSHHFLTQIQTHSHTHIKKFKRKSFRFTHTKTRERELFFSSSGVWDCFERKGASVGWSQRSFMPHSLIPMTRRFTVFFLRWLFYIPLDVNFLTRGWAPSRWKSNTPSNNKQATYQQKILPKIKVWARNWEVKTFFLALLLTQPQASNIPTQFILEKCFSCHAGGGNWGNFGGCQGCASTLFVSRSPFPHIQLKAGEQNEIKSFQK
jgi:hypothetical protein